MNRNYKNVENKVWFVQFNFWKFVFADNYNLEIIFSISWKLNYYAYNGKPVFRLEETSFFYLSVHPW